MIYIDLSIDPEFDIHGDDGPMCVKWPSGRTSYYLGDIAHRTDGPAIIERDGTQEWFINGIGYYNNQDFQLAAGVSDEDMVAMVIKYGNVK